MRCAIVDDETGEVKNVIVAGPGESAPEGQSIIQIANDSRVSEGWNFDFDKQQFTKLLIEKPLDE